MTSMVRLFRVAYCKGVPTTEEEMELLCQHDDPDTAVFYTVWSYKRGYGRTIINSSSKN